MYRPRWQPINTVGHKRRLATPADQLVTTPNNDTLYSSAWIDLHSGPVTIELPRTGLRYFSVALMDMYSNNFKVLGTRTMGEDGGTFVLAGPQFEAADSSVIRAPTPWVWLLARLLVDGADDLHAAKALQRQIKVSGPHGRRPLRFIPRNVPWHEYFAAVQMLMNENPPCDDDAAMLARIAPLGLKPGGVFDGSRFSRAEAAEIEAGVKDAKTACVVPMAGRIVKGWSYPKTNLGDFGQDYLYRAHIALDSLAALPVTEAMYMSAVDEEGEIALDSGKVWRLNFPPDALPPVDAFWSVTAYHVTADGKRFLIENPINRYSIGDRTPGLQRSSDGSLEIWLSADDPGKHRRANWLPTPKGHPFSVMLRTYLPQASLTAGEYDLPPLEIV